MADEKKRDVSVANILAIVGLAGLGVFSFLGAYLHFNDLAAPVMWAVAYVAILSFLLIFAIKAKGTTEDARSWRIVEIVCVALLVLVSVFGSAPFHHYFGINSQKNEIIAKAQTEVDSISIIYIRYNSEAEDAMKTAKENIRTFLDDDNIILKESSSMKSYISKHVIIDSVWYNAGMKIVKVDNPSGLSQNLQILESWNYMQLPSAANSIDKGCKMYWLRLTEKIKNYGEDKELELIPVFSGGNGDHYKFKGLKEFDLGTPPSGEVGNYFKADGIFNLFSARSSLLGWIVFVVLFIMIILNYLVVPGSDVIVNKDKEARFINGRSL